jgi:hypothetical protein
MGPVIATLSQTTPTDQALGHLPDVSLWSELGQTNEQR